MNMYKSNNRSYAKGSLLLRIGKQVKIELCLKRLLLLRKTKPQYIMLKEQRQD